MPLIRRANRNGHAAAATIPVGTAPSTVGSLTAGTPTTTTIPVTYTAATGTATITYAGETSLDGTTWTSNGGTFTSSGGTFSGLASATAYHLRIVASNGFGSSRTLLAGTVSTAAATTYTVAISPSSGVSGSTFSYTATPATGGWPAGEVITPTVTGGTVSPTSATGSGTTAVVFTVTATGSAGTNCIVNSTAPGMANSTGAETYAITNPSALTANRFDLILPASGAPSVSQTATLAPNAIWPSGSVTLTATNATFSSTGTSTVTLTNPGSSATVTTSFTPVAAGPVTITPTNSASMYNPMAQRMNCFASSSGTAQTLSATSRFSDLRGWQRNAFSGTPPGWNGANFTRGHGRVWFTFNQGGPALFMRVYDGQTGTTSAGSGTLLQDAVQVYGAFSGGDVGINVGAVDALLWADFATDSAFTNPIRIGQRFKVGTLIHNAFRSQWSGLTSNYAESTMPGSTFSSNTKSTSIQAHNSGTLAGATAWALHDGTTAAGGSATMPDDFFSTANNSAGTQLLGQWSGVRFGVGVSLAGCTTAGGFQGFDSYIAADGTPCGGFTEAAAAADSEGRVVMVGTNLWDTVAEAESVDGYTSRAVNFAAWVGNHMPNVSTIIFSLNSGVGNYLDISGKPRIWIGSDWRGWARLTAAVRDALANDPRCTTNDMTDWSQYVGGHAGHSTMPNYAGGFFWSMASNEPTISGGFGHSQADQAATFGTSATRVGDVIYLPVALPAGATGLVLEKSTYSGHDSVPTRSTASSAEIATLFAVYNSGGSSTNNTVKYTVQGATYNAGTGNMEITLASGQSPTSTLTLQALGDQPDQGNAYALGIYDNRTLLSGAGFAHGPLARPRLDVSVSV